MALVFFSGRFLQIVDTPVHYYCFVFCSTLCLYSSHRLYGLFKIGSGESRRYLIIQSIRIPLVCITAISFICTVVLYMYLPLDVRYLLVIPSLISAGYVLPVWNGKRMRDFNFLKIFLIAIVWTVIVVLIPAIIHGQLTLHTKYLAGAIFFYMLAITIPFDIRDLAIDTSMGVKTLPAQLGSTKMALLSSVLLSLSSALIILSAYHRAMGASVMTAVILMLLGLIIYTYRNAKNDYYYTGILDGTMLVMGILGLAY